MDAKTLTVLEYPKILVRLTNPLWFLRLETEENLLHYIQTNKVADNLIIETQHGINLISTRPIHYDLKIPKLVSIIDSSIGDIQVTDIETEHFSTAIHNLGNLLMGNLKCTSFQAEVNSSGNLTMGELLVETPAVQISSSRNLEIAGGVTQQQETTISSLGDYLARELESVEVRVQLSSSGSATIRINQVLNATLTSRGNVYYIWNPTVGESEYSSGRVVQISE